jgi:magnesium-transporting ATPase (P-type)
MIKENRVVVLGRRVGLTEIAWVDVDSDAVVKTPSVPSLAESGVELAMTGEAWGILRATDPKYATTIAKHIRVFGRCNPADKVSVIANFVKSGFTTLMCGDGANDCGSLKTVHIGIALSTSEASIVAPFTSLDKSISSVTEVLREGRCALASAMSVYSYHLRTIRGVLHTIIAYLAVSFSEWCWVFLDGIRSITMVFSLPLPKPSKRLSPSRQTASLLGSQTMFSVSSVGTFFSW